MKKIMVLFLFFYLTFNCTPALSINAISQNIFKQGVYTLSDLNHSSENLYEVKNISSKEYVYLAIFDEENIILQSIRLTPNSICYNIVPLKQDYKIVLLGKGEVFINPKATK